MVLHGTVGVMSDRLATCCDGDEVRAAHLYPITVHVARTGVLMRVKPYLTWWVWHPLIGTAVHDGKGGLDVMAVLRTSPSLHSPSTYRHLA